MKSGDDHAITLRLLKRAYKGREHTWQFKAAIANLARQRLDEQLDPPALEAESQPTPVEKKPRKCSRCGRPGHRADRCPLGVSLPEALDRQNEIAAPAEQIASPPLEARSVRAHRGRCSRPPRRPRRMTTTRESVWSFS